MLGSLPPGIGEVLSGLSVLALALALSFRLPPSRAMGQVALLTFGIYLLHDLVLEGFEFLFKLLRFSEISFAILVAVSLAAFAISALIVFFGSRLGKPGR